MQPAHSELTAIPQIRLVRFHPPEANKIATSQIALPGQGCQVVYATAGYELSVANLGATSVQSDMVFGDDGGEHQLGTTTGDVDGGYTVELTVPV